MIGVTVRSMYPVPGVSLLSFNSTSEPHIINRDETTVLGLLWGGLKMWVAYHLYEEMGDTHPVRDGYY